METIVGSVPSACAAVSKISPLANVQLGIVGTGMEMVEQSVFTGMGTVLSMCAVVSKVSVLANVQVGIVVLETEWEVVAVGLVGDVHAGTSLETVTVAVGVSVNMVMSAVSEVGWMEGKTGPCAALNVDVAWQDMNTT